MRLRMVVIVSMISCLLMFSCEMKSKNQKNKTNIEGQLSMSEEMRLDIEKIKQSRNYQTIKTEIANKYGTKLIAPAYLPERFIEDGIFMQENPAIRDDYVVRRIWYDPNELEFLSVNIYKIDSKDIEDEYYWTSITESGESINQEYSWANYRCGYGWVQNGIGVKGFMLLNSEANKAESKKILESLKE